MVWCSLDFSFYQLGVFWLHTVELRDSMSVRTVPIKSLLKTTVEDNGNIRYYCSHS